MGTPARANGQQPRRAVIYLRVSSPGQVKTDYDPEGLSIPAQRAACVRKAEALGATVVREYVEPGFSGGSLLSRKRFQDMLRDLRELRDVDVVIVWNVSRWARDRRDDANMLFEVESCGASLVSVTENIDASPSGRMLHGFLATIAEYERNKLSQDVSRGIQRKVEVGGTPHQAPFGYRNVHEQLADGRVVRTVESTRSAPRFSSSPSSSMRAATTRPAS